MAYEPSAWDHSSDTCLEFALHCLAWWPVSHGHLQVETHIGMASVIERAKHQYVFKYFANDQHSSLMLYRTMQLEYKPAEYLSVVKCASNRRLMSRFRTGCHSLRVDTDRWADDVHLDRTDRLCLVCKSLDCVEDEQHFVFDCPAYSHIRSQHSELLQHCCTIADFVTLCEPNACGGFLRECFACRKQILSVRIH